MLGSLTDNLKKWKATRTAGQPISCQTIAVCSRKGGVGKTTTTAHLAVASARWHGLRVLVVDLDPQGHIHKVLAHLLNGEDARPLSSVFMSKKGDILDACVSTTIPNLWIAPADESLDEVQTLLSSRIGREFILKSMLSRVQESFDLVLFDCPPNVDTLTLNALVASRHVLIPTELTLLALEGVADIVEAVDTIRDRLGLPVEILGVVVSRMDRRTKALNRELLEILDSRYGAHVLSTMVPANSAVPRACIEGKPVFDYDPKSLGAEGFRLATEEVLDRLT